MSGKPWPHFQHSHPKALSFGDSCRNKSILCFLFLMCIMQTRLFYPMQWSTQHALLSWGTAPMQWSTQHVLLCWDTGQSAWEGTNAVEHLACTALLGHCTISRGGHQPYWKFDSFINALHDCKMSSSDTDKRCPPRWHQWNAVIKPPGGKK